jgi:hypothetical protein
MISKTAREGLCPNANASQCMQVVVAKEALIAGI